MKTGGGQQVRGKVAGVVDRRGGGRAGRSWVESLGMAGGQQMAAVVSKGSAATASWTTEEMRWKGQVRSEAEAAAAVRAEIKASARPS